MIINMLEDKKEPEQKKDICKDKPIWEWNNPNYYGSSTTATGDTVYYVYTICV